MKSLRKLPDRVAIRFMDLMTKYMSDPSANGLNLETVEGSKDSSIKSLRVDQGYRAIAFEVGRDIMFVHVNEHDKAYRWGCRASGQTRPGNEPDPGDRGDRIDCGAGSRRSPFSAAPLRRRGRRTAARPWRSGGGTWRSAPHPHD
jgi:hypothetical protein